MMAVPGTIYHVGTPQEVFTKENISTVYGVECEVIEHKGHPHVILEKALEICNH